MTTKLADMLVPDVWAQYIINRSLDKSLLIQSGIATNVGTNDDVATALQGGGKTVNLPFFEDLTGDDDVQRDDQDIIVNGIDTDKDVAPVLLRHKAFGATDLSAELSGADPMGAIGNLFANYWNRMQQKTLVAELNGVMGEVTDNVLNISAEAGSEAVFNGEAFVDAQGLLGDRQEELVGAAMHSATYTLLKKQGLIEFRADDEGKFTIPTYMGRDLVIDDNMPVSAGVYTTYLFGRGAVAFAEVTAKNAAEAGRDSLKNGGMDFIVNRKKFIMHTRGVAWNPTNGVPALSTPSNAELASAGNWNQVYDSKAIRVVQFKHRVAAVPDEG